MDGSMAAGIFMAARIDASQSKVCRSISMVREALVTSVACVRPFESFHSK
jgi:hypothetical protein